MNHEPSPYKCLTNALLSPWSLSLSYSTQFQMDVKEGTEDRRHGFGEVAGTDIHKERTERQTGRDSLCVPHMPS